MLETLCAWSLVTMLGLCEPPTNVAVGSVEGDYVRLAPIETARIVSMAGQRGGRVAAGDVLAVLEEDDVAIAERDAAARLDQARADLANLKLGKRAEEIAVQEATLASAKAQALDAEKVLNRKRDLFDRGFAAQSDLDQATTARDVATARVTEIAANLAVMKLPARADEITAAESRVAQAQAALDQARWRRDQRRLRAPAAGQIADVIRHPGDVAGPAAPALLLLPDGAVKLRFFVPQAAIATLVLGQEVGVACDGCAAGLTARVSYIANEPEFTPPVIYSNEARQKLVYLVEARPDGAATTLKPGQIVDVTLPEARP
ncbi:MAG: HlyD family secretion protein [Labrys sp. (in: a-proteobacteria)]